MSKSKLDPIDAFMGSVHEAQELAERISSYLNDFMNVDPDRIEWPQVGSAEHIASMLREIVTVFRIPEFPEPEQERAESGEGDGTQG